MRYSPSRVLLSLFLLASLGACGGGGGGGDADEPTVLPGIYVNAASGSDVTGDGSKESPFRTITMGLKAAVVGDVVRVAAGLYDVALGEVFPLEPRPGVAIKGTEQLNVFGGGPPLTRVVGGGFWDGDPDGRLHATVVPGSGTAITGLSLHNPEPFGPFDGPKPAAIVLAQSNVQIERCVLHESDKGVRMVAGSRDSTLRQVTFSENGIGIFVSGAGTGIRVERCTVIDNSTGVMAFTPGVDFGGGAAGSEGLNAFVNSDTNDFVYFTGTSDTASAKNCFWDVRPPTVATGSPPSQEGTDIWQASGSVDTTGAQKFRTGPVVLPSP